MIELLGTFGLNSYEGASSDEICLVSAAKQQGFVFLGSTSNSVVLNIGGQEKEYLKIHTFEFDSKRKMMSVIIKDEEGFKLYLKGADSSVLSRIAPNQSITSTVRNKVQAFSREGLRTLVMAMRKLSAEEVESIQKRLETISVAQDRETLLGNFSFKSRYADGRCGERSCFIGSVGRRG